MNKIVGICLIHFVILNGQGQANSLVWETLFNSNPDCIFSHDISHEQMQSLLLHWAAQEGKDELIQTMISHGVYVDLRDHKGQTALFIAVRNNHPKVVALLLEAGAQVNAQDNMGRSTLFIVLPEVEKKPCGEQIEYLITARKADYLSWIPVYVPPDNRYTHVTQLLLDYGALPGLKDNDGRTALHWAAVFGRIKVARLLLANQAPLNALDTLGGTPLSEAAAQGYEEMVELFVNIGANVNLFDKQKGQSPVACAALFGRTDIVAYLLEHGAAVQEDTFALYAAALAGFTDIMELLLESGANTEIKHFDGKTVLAWVASQGDLDMANLLIKYGAQLSAKDTKGKTPVDLALEKGHLDLVAFLVEQADTMRGTFYIPFL